MTKEEFIAYKDAEEPGIVECEIRCNDSVGQFYFNGLNMCPLSQVNNRYDFVGLKFEGYSDIFNDVIMYEWNGKLYREVSLDWIMSGKAKVLHATSVLFWRQK